MSKDKEERGNELNDIHNKGQEDGYNNKYDPPSRPGFFTSRSLSEELLEDKEAYDKGYDSGKKNR